MKKEAVKYGTQNPDVCKLCNDLSRSLDDKCWSKLTWYHFAAAFLYPEYTNHASMMAMETEVDRVRLDLRAMVSSMSSGQTEPVAKKPKTVLFDSDSSESEDRNSQEEGLRQAGDEFDRYCSSTFDCDDGQMKPLHFWKTQAKRFPNLWCIYAIPATQNKSEHAFSAAAHVMTDLRTTLDPDHLDELLLIRSHSKQ